MTKNSNNNIVIYYYYSYIFQHKIHFTNIAEFAEIYTFKNLFSERQEFFNWNT